jgi:hypothetical protein
VTRKTTPEETTQPPAEFSAFVRRIGINSFDRFAEKKSGSRSGAKAGNPLKALADLWLGLTPKEKERFFDQVIAAGQAAAVAAPAVLAMAKSKATKKSADKADESPKESEKKKEKKPKKKKKSEKGSEEKKPKKSKKKD